MQPIMPNLSGKTALVTRASRGIRRASALALAAADAQAFKRLVRPDNVGGVVAFLASEVARWITGDAIRVDGGSKL
jgi:NAD(P)-dependent dehydrogenase (short-subunit alcohol dehydrogenase family)